MLHSIILLIPETYIAFSALSVSIISVVFTFVALKHQREHNFKSVKPIGIISPGDYEDDIFVRIDNNGERVDNDSDTFNEDGTAEMLAIYLNFGLIFKL